MTGIYNSGRRRVHGDGLVSRIVATIHEYVDFCEKDEPTKLKIELMETAADLCNELEYRLRQELRREDTNR